LLELEADLHEAVRRGEFVVHYQPQLAADTGEMVAVEALVRWRHPQRGLLAPAEFIGLAEERGLIGAIDAWVVSEAAAQCKRWEDAGLPPVRVAVNLSAHHFRGSGPLAMVAKALRDTGLRPDLFELELTETAVMHEPARVAELLGQLRQLGVGLALDDFGTGYSTLSHLQHLKVDVLKIDRSFVSQISNSPRDREIVAAVMAMSHALGTTVVGEGIETTDQLDALTGLDCDQGQGFLFARPLSPEAVVALVG